LAVLADDRVDPVLLQLEGHAVARRIGPFSDRLGGWAPGPTAPQDDRCSTRPRLTTPMSPVGLPSRRGVLRPPGRP
ncbi:MAG TPA: hypothetical protein VF174_01815, partial [Micromonosporaceae bacterium]